MDADQVELMRSTFSQVFGSTSTGELRSTLVDLGIVEAFDDDLAAVVEIMFEEQGRAQVGSPALDVVLAHHIDPALVGSDGDQPSVLLPPLAASAHTPARTHGAMVAVDGITFGDATSYLVAIDDGGSTHIATIDAEALEATVVQGFDPDLGLRLVRGEISSASLSHIGDGDSWASSLELAQRALGHELVGVAEQLLAMALAHVMERHQFGQPLGLFQAVKHRLAEVQIGITASRRMLAVAWELGGELPSTLAKAQSGKAAILAAKHCQQVCGGIGFTWEHGLHRAVRRAYTLDSVLGPAQALQTTIGQHLIDSRTVPRLAQL